MRFALIGLAAVALAGCKPLPDSQVAKDEREFAWVQAPDGSRDCLIYETAEDEGLIGKGSSAKPCLRFLPAQRWKGIWHEEEHWYFCASDGDECDERSQSYLLVWRSPSPRELRTRGKERRVKIVFVGRRTAVKGGYQMWPPEPHAILVEKIISAQPLPESAAQ